MRKRLSLACLGLGVAAILSAIAVPAAPAAKNAAHGTPRRIVSLNLCADQYLFALADRTQIAGLTHNADNPQLSAIAGKVRGLRILGQSAEEILALDPDLLVGVPARRSAVMAALRRQNYETLDMKGSEGFNGIPEQVRLIAAAIGHPDRGEALIARMERELAGLPKPGRGRVAAYYQRRGYLTGAGTLIDDLMTRAGLVNLATKIGKPALSRLSVEEMVAAKPDIIILDSATERVTDQGTEMLHHPALRDIPRVYIPQAWTVCGGPAYVDAAKRLVGQL